MKRLLLYMSVCTALAMPLSPAHSQQSATTLPVSALVQTVRVDERLVADMLQAFGTIEPGPRQLKVIAAPRTSEVQLDVVAGVRVKRGEPLVTLMPTPDAAVAYAQAKSQAGYAYSALRHTRALFQEHLATRNQVAAAEKALLDAQANLAAQRQMGGGHAAVMRAPADGVITAVTVASGARVAANAMLLTLAEQGDMYARLGVDPQRAPAIRIGMPVTLRAVFDPRLALRARVNQVGGMVAPVSGLVDVLVPLPGRAAAGFLPGSHVTAEIALSRGRSLAVPRSAVLRDAQGAYVFIVKDHVAHRVQVHTGTDDGTWIAVRGGLHAGERVVTLGNYELRDGMAVREQAP